MNEPPILHSRESEPPLAHSSITNAGGDLPASPADAKNRRFPCKGCGAGLEYHPGSDSVKCPYCNFVEKITLTDDEIAEFCFNDYLAKPPSGIGVAGTDQPCAQQQCAPCGAVIHFEAHVKATKCPFCGSTMVARAGDTGDADVRPEAVAPFKIKQIEAERLFHNWVRKLWFAPSLLKQEMNQTKIRGVYVPYWTYDSETLSSYTGERGDYYYVTQSYTTMVNGKPSVQTRQVRHVRWRWVSGRYDTFFDDVLVSCGKEQLQLFYDIKNLMPYDPAFLSGFDAERPSIKVDDGWKSAKQQIQNSIYHACCRKIGGDTQRSVNIKTAYRAITFKMVLLPVYISTYRFKKKIYRFEVDGQTGQVKGQRPYSFWKIFGFVMLILVAAGFVALAALFAVEVSG
ncbi:MAG: zinc finger domain-containing protein [Planctomycetota bacterium]